MKQIVKVLCLTAMLIGAGTMAHAQFRQSIFLNGNIPTGEFASTARPANGDVPLGYTEIGRDASVGFGLGYRAGYRFDVGVGDVAPFASIDFLWNTIAGKWSDKYSDARYSTPTYFNIPLMVGVTYIYDELPWSDISAYGEFGVGTDLLWITSEGGTTAGVNYEYAYKANFAFSFMIGAGAYFGRHVSAGLYYYGFGTHEIDYTDNTLKEHNLSASDLQRERRTVGSVMLRVGFHF